ncbi:type IV pili biogenesis protein PilN [Alcanivorax hongdengensis A-11-3]|uniref:Type IV pili biogenesis protein PilN n=1 Tax=Alcanivorax hongdengensis A-11-3 TaxID=1177179 RepID=L0WIV8_9GAMM|nr:PilN domain-containing protein [Alcanivorax hongdengensis]EKF76112.1 type IV pili biogenesis protein PilN [Alcanivorax hongdengensis A-11-3]
MTTTINLLPWREERRQQQQQEFIALLVLAVIVGGLIFWLWKGHVEQQVADQRARNNFIEQKTSELDKKISEIKDLKARRDELVARMKVIQDLQGNRPTIVYVFDQLARTLPDGVYYTSVERKGDLYTIQGVAESNNRISRLMRNLSNSAWFEDPALQKVEAQDEGSQANTFSLTVKQSSPNSKKEEKEQ